MRRKLLLSVVVSCFLFCSSVGYGKVVFPTGGLVHSQIQDPISALVEALFLAIQYTRKDTEIDASAGIKKIKDNIGQGDGPGISATGASGADTVTDEEAAEMVKAAEEEAATVPNLIIELIEKKEADFKKVQAVIADQAFVRDSAEVNADCECDNGKKGTQCSPVDCAVDRQNEDLMTASTAASTLADSFFQKGQDESYEKLQGLIDQINSDETLIDFVADMGAVSVYSSDQLVDMIELYAYDLAAQSYRNLSTVGVAEVDVAQAVKGDVDDDS